MIYHYLDLKKSSHTFRQQVIALNNMYTHHYRPVLDSCRLELEHQGKEIAVNAILKLHNENKRPVDTLVFSLNPDLLVENLSVNSHPVNSKEYAYPPGDVDRTSGTGWKFSNQHALQGIY